MIHHLILAALPLLQGGDVGVQAQFEPSAAQVGAPVELRVKLTIPPGFHLYHPDQNPDDGIPVSVAVPSGFEAAGALRSLKEPETHIDQIGKTRVEYLWLTGKSELILPLAVAEGANGSFETTIAVDVQVCDEMMCFPPDTIHANGVEFDRLPGK
ncbi:MAG: protein-disulfide reductase DsbD family protein, partial [Planctomycetota bacterium]|nr:protein-disulfide reductase DsbD family protein [Planctomycetota bacterium]